MLAGCKAYNIHKKKILDYQFAVRMSNLYHYPKKSYPNNKIICIQNN